MPSNVIIFDAEYIAEVTSNMNMACTLVGEAVNFLKKASLHEGWQCKECAAISENLDDLNKRLGRLDEGVNETTRILRGSVSRFEELERKYRDQRESLSRDLRSNYGFTGSGYTGSSGSSGSTWAGSPAAGAPGSDMPGVPAGQTATTPASSGTAGMTAQGNPAGANVQGETTAETVQQTTTAPTGTAQPNTIPQTGTAQTTTPQTGGAASTSTSIGGAQTGTIPVGMTQTGTNQTYTPYTDTNQNYSPSWNIASGDIQLPVTHIPDRPEAVAEGVKAVVEVENVAVDSVTDSIVTILGSSANIYTMPQEVQTTAAQYIADTYSTGRQVSDNASAIISNPSIAHVQENIAMAAGMVKLIGGLSKTLSALGIPGLEGFEDLGALADGLTEAVNTEAFSAGMANAGAANAGAVSSSDAEISAMNAEISGDAIAGDVMGGNSAFGSGMHFTSAGFSTNAESIIGNMGSDANSQELKEVLQTMTSKGGSGQSGSSGNFIEKIKSSIMEKMQGGVSLGALGSVNIKDFLEKVI